MAMNVWNPADSDEETENSETFHNRNRSAHLCIIDVTPDMFRPCWGDNEDIPFIAALKCCHALWRTTIVSSSKDLVGILLCGSEKHKNSSDFPNLYVLHDLSPVTVNMLLELDILKKSQDFSGFEQNIGSSSQYNLHDAFWLSKILFEDAKTNAFEKKITFFTCEDNPHSNQIEIQDAAVNKIRDLGNIDFQIVSFNEHFDQSKFYSRVLESESSLKLPESMASLLKISRMKQRRQRPIYHSTLEISPEFKIGVGIYSMARRTAPPKTVKINKRNNEPVTKNVSQYRSDTGMPVLKSEQVSVVEVKGEQAIFTKDELKTSKYAYDTGLSLIGFLDQSKFDQFKWFRSDGYFLYPDDDKWNGSKNFFSCLLRRCIVLKKCVLVRGVLSRGRTPKLGCLIPISGNGEKIPQGFYLFMLPFADEIRDLSALCSAAEASTNLVNLMEQVVKKTTQKNFDLLNIQNPVLQMKWREIEAAIFNEEEIEFDEGAFQDFTEPNVDSMRHRVGEQSQQIMSLVRTESKSFLPALAKRPKLDINMQMEAKNKRVEKLTVDILKEYLESVHVSTKGMRKADLVAAVYEYFKIK